MKLLTILLVAGYVLFSQSVLAAERSVVLDVENMTCALCPITVSKAIKSIDGVADVKVDMDNKTATVVYDDAIAQLAEIADASTFAGYPAAVRSAQ